MHAKIQKWGNSQGIRINKEILEQTNLAVGDRVEIIARDGKVIVQPETKKKMYRLEDLIAQIPEGYKSSGEEIKSSTGKEEW